MALEPRVRLVAGQPPELIVYDEPSECSYLADETWRLPLRLPVRPLAPDEFGERLAAGDRRQGRLLYRTACPTCRACEPIRIDVTRFKPSKSQRRAVKKGDKHFTIKTGMPRVDKRRVELYNAHKRGRSLAAGEGLTSQEAYRSFLGDTCCETFEMRYEVDGKLVGVAIVDRADDALSAVYFYYDPALEHLSPGTYSIMKQVELCRALGLRYLYLGLYIHACKAMAYKGRYLPHERLIGRKWQRFDRQASIDAQKYEAPVFPSADEG